MYRFAGIHTLPVFLFFRDHIFVEIKAQPQIIRCPFGSLLPAVRIKILDRIFIFEGILQALRKAAGICQEIRRRQGRAALCIVHGGAEAAVFCFAEPVPLLFADAGYHFSFQDTEKDAVRACHVHDTGNIMVAEMVLCAGFCFFLPILVFLEKTLRFGFDGFFRARVYFCDDPGKCFRDIVLCCQFRISAVYPDPFFRIHGEQLTENGFDRIRFDFLF